MRRCPKTAEVLDMLRLDKVYHHPVEPDHHRSRGTLMADMPDGTILSSEKACCVCGGHFRPTPTAVSGACSTACRNRLRTDHTFETLMRRFWAKVDKTPGLGPNGDCWLWKGRRNGHGYGEIKVAGVYRAAHRIALFGVDNLKTRLFACHHCDNPQCVRPEHLFAGEAVDNIRDMFLKGRAGNVGATTRKLTDDDVRAIRESSDRQCVLARRFNVNGSAIRQIRLGATYRDVI